MSFSEHNKRSITKALTFRVIATAAELVITFLITHRYDITIGVVVVSDVTTTLLYYFHERFWNKIRWGKESS